MARKDEAHYIRFYTDGSTAYQIEPKKQPKRPAPAVRPKRKRVTISVDFLALWGIVVAALLLVQMVVGVFGLTRLNQEVAQMEAVVSQRVTENSRLRQEYRASYDPGQIRAQALEMGMIPARQAKVILIPMEDGAEAEKTEAVTFWTFLMDLFA